MLDTSRAGETITRMLHAIDAKDWRGLRDAFADTLDMDYQSLFGDPPIRIDTDQQVNGWRQFAGALDVTQHVTGPIVISPDSGSAIADTHVRAYHRIKGADGGDVWMVAGHYRVKLIPVGEAWRIAGITLTVFYQEGNLRIPEIARARVGAQ
jgi:SnoaL-like domain